MVSVYSKLRETDITLLCQTQALLLHMTLQQEPRQRKHAHTLNVTQGACHSNKRSLSRCCTLSVKTVKPVLNALSSTVYRCFERFDERAFSMDLHFTSLKLLRLDKQLLLSKCVLMQKVIHG